MALCTSNLSKRFFPLLKKNSFDGTRYLLSDALLRINEFKKHRKIAKEQYPGVENQIRQEVKEYIEITDCTLMVKKIKSMLHIAEKNSEDLDLVLRMIKKYNSSYRQVASRFAFSPLLMRTYYYLNEPHEALKAFTDPTLENFFSSLTAHEILLDLLFTNKMYKHCREIYSSYLKQRYLSKNFNPRNPFILFMAACYKENSEESLKCGLDLLDELENVSNFIIPRRGLTCLAALALKHNKPEVALDVCSRSDTGNYIDIRCIKLEAYAQLQKFEDVQSVLNFSLSNLNQTYFIDTLWRVQQAFAEDTEKFTKIGELIGKMTSSNLIEDRELEHNMLSPLGPVLENDFSTSENELENRIQRGLNTKNAEMECISSLKTDNFLRSRNYFKQRRSNEIRIKAKIASFVENDDATVDKQDILNLLYVADRDPRDIDLVMKAIKKHHALSGNDLNPIDSMVMRMFYCMDAPELALQAFKDTNLKDFFAKIVSHELLLSLLLKFKMYDECLKVMDDLKKNYISRQFFPKNPVILVTLACYRQNTMKSLQYGCRLISELISMTYLNFKFPRRALTTLAALALKLEKPEVVLELISLLPEQNFIEVRSLKLEALVHSKQYYKVSDLLSKSLSQKSNDSFFIDTIDRVEKITEGNVCNLLAELRFKNLVSKMTLEEHVNSPVKFYGTDIHTKSDKKNLRISSKN